MMLPPDVLSAVSRHQELRYGVRNSLLAGGQQR